MTTPTIFSDKAVNPKVAKFMPQGMLFQKATVFVPSGTTIGTVIGVIRVSEGFVLDGFSIQSDDIGSGATINIGYVLDDTTGEDLQAYVTQSAIISSGAEMTWPGNVIGTPNNIGKSPVITGDGYITFEIADADTDATGNIYIDSRFTYDE
jgi:hypothetical protein